MRFFLAVATLLLFSLPAHAQPRAEQAFTDAVALFEAAYPALEANDLGVDVAAYRDALTLRRFSSAHWGRPISLHLAEAGADDANCRRFAAYVRIPPADGRVRLVLCPQFFRDGSDGLRRLTILHELVHAVAGPDECRAMAFAARIEYVATGSFTPVERYWQANGCPDNAFRLPG